MNKKTLKLAAAVVGFTTTLLMSTSASAILYCQNGKVMNEGTDQNGWVTTTDTGMQCASPVYNGDT